VPICGTLIGVSSCGRVTLSQESRSLFAEAIGSIEVAADEGSQGVVVV
jgi:hypothetical protein